MKTKVLFGAVAAVLCFQVNQTQAQKKSKPQSYFATDSTLVVGAKVIASSRASNSEFIKIEDKGKITTYSALQITQYGLSDGTVYESYKIHSDNEEKTVFLERLVSGKITLYRYVDREHRTYYIRKDSTDLQELQKDMGALKFASQDCEFMADAIRLASYTPQSLQKLASRYDKCESKPFPYAKVGILAGFRQMSLQQPSGYDNSLLNDNPFPSSGSLAIGVFADLPIFMSEFSFHPEVFYTMYKVAASSYTTQAEVDALVSLSTLHVPLLFRYTVPTLTWRPFFDAGPYFSYNLKNSSDIYYATTNNNTVTIEKPLQDKLVSDYIVGYSAGAGLQRKLNYKKTVSAELRYTRAAGQDNTSLTQKAIELIVGFTF